LITEKAQIGWIGGHFDQSFSAVVEAQLDSDLFRNSRRNHSDYRTGTVLYFTVNTVNV
jgi:hypothetical protein